jgi:prepilin-type N-terminal cleavage/methylation domain-containing protein
MLSKSRGFTIVELLIVIVVIAILAAISIVAYNGVQDRATKSRRISDMSTIVKALELYKAEKGYYPAAQPNSSGGWERSAVNPANFLQALKNDKILSTVPVDPKNSAPLGSTGAENTFTSYTYYLYTSGSPYGCDTSVYGPVYVLKIEAPGNAVSYPETPTPGMTCGSLQVNGKNGATPYWVGKTTN